MLKVFSVHDSKAEAYIQPFFSVNRAVAIRDFTRACMEPQSGFCRHPADYVLYELGEFDPASGSFNLCDKVALGSALEFKSAAEGLEGAK